MWRKLFSLLVLSMMATASADCPSGQCMANDGSCMDNPSGQCMANDGSCMDNSCEHAGYGDAYCQQFWGSTSTCSNGECVNSCTATQYTCAEVATGYTTNCGTCGNTSPETASGLEKPAARLTELEKLTKFKQWICENKDYLRRAVGDVGRAWSYMSNVVCDHSVNSVFYGLSSGRLTPLDF